MTNDLRKLKYDKEQMRKTCYFAIENEQKKGNIPLNDNGEPLTNEEYFKDTDALFNNPVFVKAALKHLKNT